MASLVTIEVPKEYGYVLLVAANSYILASWLGVRIGPFRKAANVPHPHVSVSREAIANASSPKEKRALYLFDCAQRGHHNFVENYPPFLTSMLIAGMKYPKTSALAGAVWVDGRVLYAIGYTRDVEENINGKGRFFAGGFHTAAFAQIGLIALVGKMGLDLLWA